MKKPRAILLLTLCAAISIEGCAGSTGQSFCEAVPVPAPFPEKASIDISEERILYDDGGLKVLQEYAATREALQAACGL
jgi:hypothetical protein